MSIRNNEKNLTNRHDFPYKVPMKRDVATCTENFTLGLGQAPIFNIHIHVPPNNQTNTTPMYLPKILPIIHVHFDELSKNLKKNLSQQNEELHEKHFENIGKEITPKLGNVFLHCENDDRHCRKNEMNTVNEKQTLREKDSSIEFEGCQTDETDTMNSYNHSNVLDNNDRTEGIGDNRLPNVVVHNGHTIKLKKAVVVLEDVLKTNSYNNGRISNLLNHQENETSNSPLNEVGNYPQIKTEPQCSNDGNSCLNSSNSSSISDSVNSGFPNAEKTRRKEILDSLVQGCNFSEILQKFKTKYGKNSIVKLESLLSKSVIKSSEDRMVENDKGTINGVVEPTQNGVQTKKEAVEIDQSHDIGDKQQGEPNYNKDGIRSNETENQQCENFINCDTEMSGVELGNSVTPSAEAVKNGVDQMHGDQGLINPVHEDEFVSDENEITTENKSSSDFVQNLKNLEVDTSNCMSDVVIKSEFGSVERNDLILNSEGDFDLNLVKKEVISPEKSIDKMAKTRHEKRNSSDGREDECSPKKMKQSPKTSKISATKASKSDDYIPLNIPGPTEFAVVPLSKVQAREGHNAKNFKNDMLFGNRVNRFTNAENLNVYKLKKQAAKTRSE